MLTFGEYKFDNYSIINAFVDHPQGLNSTTIHETLHLLLTQSTEYGFLSLLVNRLVKFAPEIKSLHSTLYRHMSKLQESISTFAEIMVFASKHNIYETNNFITSLKITNNKYYNYIRKDLLKIYRNCNYEDKSINFLKPLELMSIIYRIAFISMSCSWTNIPAEIILQKKKLRKFLVNQNVLKYIPNSRFVFLINSLKKILKSNQLDDIKKDNLFDTILTDFPDSTFYKHLIYDIDFRTVYTRKYINSVKEYLKNILINVQNYELIENTIDRFKEKEIDIDKIHHFVVPESFRPLYNSNLESKENVMKEAIKDFGIFFILIDSEYRETINNSMMYINEDFFNQIHDKYPAHMIVIFMDYIKKKTFPMMFPERELHLLLNHHNTPVVINYKLMNLSFKLSEISSEMIYIYCDRPYITAKDTIKLYLHHKCFARLLEYNNMVLLIIRLNKNLEFFLPVVKSLYNDILIDILNQEIEIEIDNNLDIDINKYDLIINTLFYL